MSIKRATVLATATVLMAIGSAAGQSDNRQLCFGPQTSPDDWVKGCSAIIDSGDAKGRDLAAALAQRGFAFTLKRNLPEAQKDLDLAVKTDPSYPPVFVNRANFYNVVNKLDLAMADAESAIKLDPTYPMALLVRGNVSLKQANYDRAIADYNEVLKLRPKAGAEVLSQRAVAYYRGGDYDHAIADYDELIKLDPNNVNLYLSRGDAWRRKSDFAHAAEDYGAAIRLAPDNPGGWSGRGSVRFMNQDSANAVADLTEAVRLNPKAGADFLNRGGAYSFLKDYPHALADFDTAIKLEPNHPLAYVNRALVMIDIGDKAGAAAVLRFAQTLAKDFPPTLEAMKKLGKGDPRYKPVPPDKKVSSIDCLMPVSGMTLDDKTVNRILASCSELINTPGGDASARADVFQQRGSMYRRQGKFDLALADFTVSLGYDPKSALAYTGRGNANRSLGKLDESIADHSEAIRIDPKYVEAYSNRGNA
jgi:tetratricopeptide (TPR) repeat protein